MRAFVPSMPFIIILMTMIPAMIQKDYEVVAVVSFVLCSLGYVLFRAFSKHFNYRITEKGVRVIYWDDYPEIAAQSLHFLAGVYILVAIIAGLYMGPMALAGAGGIGLVHAMGMQRITRNEVSDIIEWKDLDKVTVCRKRNVLDWEVCYRVYFTDAMSIDEFIDFANRHRDKPVEVIDDVPIMYE